MTIERLTQSKRIKIYPADRQQMEATIAAERDSELKKAYTEMLEGCLEHPKEWDWNAMWVIENEDGTHIGDLCFKGFEAGKNPEIGYGINDEFRGRGYATEATKLALEWAFSQPDVKAVEAETDPDNIASQRVLAKCGFKATGTVGEEGPRFIVYKEKEIRKATATEMLTLWGYKDFDTASPTAKFFYNNITDGNADFWTVDKDGELIAELYVFFDLDDKDFADGKITAYLCAFRVKPEYRGRGIGSRLMRAVLSDLKDKGYLNVTIGVGSDEPQNIRLYERLGFNTKIKDCHYDPCGMDENMQPKYEDTVWWLLRNDL